MLPPGPKTRYVLTSMRKYPLLSTASIPNITDREDTILI